MSIIIFMLFASFVVHNNTANACECPLLSEESSLETIERAALIFDGTITALEIPEQPEKDFDYTLPRPIPKNPLFAKLRLKPDVIYKGQPEGARVEAYIDVATSCGTPVQLSDYLTFILTPVDEVLVQADNCTAFLPAHWDELRAGTFKKEEQ